ncbi:MAG: hypothetical protein II656_03965 [Ruminococcus sp.]|nr:hypothetical protein [Ruminococcus sp.]
MLLIDVRRVCGNVLRCPDETQPDACFWISGKPEKPCPVWLDQMIVRSTDPAESVYCTFT